MVNDVVGFLGSTKLNRLLLFHELFIARHHKAFETRVCLGNILSAVKTEDDSTFLSNVNDY